MSRGQNFTKPEYFHPRPSSAGSGYDHEVVDFDGISLRVVHYTVENGIPYESSVPLDVELIKAFKDSKQPLMFTPKEPIPADAVTASGSGLDPDISPANARHKPCESRKQGVFRSTK